VVYLISVYWYTQFDGTMSSTTIKVSKSTVAELEKLREQLNARSLDEAVRLLIRKHRMDALREALGADRGKIRSFTEEDRGEDR
jgi:hypothetical protein